MADTEVAAYNMETDISKLEAPTFTTIERNQPAPMLALGWDHQVSLVGKKVLNPMIHCCDTCRKPILIYGRMIPCKHVFCLGCAKQVIMDDKQCPRCHDDVSRVENAGLGSIFLCTQGGSRYGNTGCRRTYLSRRDLHAHITHRHSKGKDEEKISDKKDMNNTEAIRNAVNSLSKASLAAAVAAAGSASPYSSAPLGAPAYPASTSSLPPSAGPYSGGAGPGYRGAGSSAGLAANNHIAVINTRQSNLITVPIHGDGAPVPEGGGGGPLHPSYVPASYSPYSAYPAQPGPAGQPNPSVTYPQTGPPSYNQPPPAYAYPGNYASAPPPTNSSQYSSVPPTGGAPPYIGVAGPPQGGYAPPGGGYPGPSGPPYQGQWNRPPPGGVRPPPGSNHQNYYRR